MKLLQTYSRSASVEIKHKPVLLEKFFPLGDITNYITIQSSSGMPAKNYSYFQEVIDLIQPVLEKKGIKILHLGQDSPPLNKTINLNNQTTLAQAAFILKRSMLHLGADSWMAHFCGSENVPLVALYGSTSVDNHSPYHFNKEKTIFIESHRNGNKPTFAREENPKTVDMIKPEEVAISVCKLLNIEYNYPFQTVKIGNSYANKIIESDCANVINIGEIRIPNIIVRCDYNFNLAVLIEQMKIGKVCIVTDKAIPINILKEFKPNIIEVLVEIKSIEEASFVKELFDNRIPYRMYTRLATEKLNNIKLNYLDYGLIVPKASNMPSELNDIDINSLYYKGSKITLGRNKIYSSKWAYVNDIPQDSFELKPQSITDKNLHMLWEEEDCCLFLKKS